MTKRDEQRAYAASGVVLFGATAVILAALAFEYIGGYRPCPLCLQQRWAYYGGIPLAFAGMVTIAAGWWRLAALLMGAVALVFIANAGLGSYHAGAEWGFWPGPQGCADDGATLSTKAGSLLEDLAKERPVRCDRAPWTLMGLSFAGWNVVASAMLALFAVTASGAARRRVDRG